MNGYEIRSLVFVFVNTVSATPHAASPIWSGPVGGSRIADPAPEALSCSDASPNVALLNSSPP